MSHWVWGGYCRFFGLGKKQVKIVTVEGGIILNSNSQEQYYYYVALNAHIESTELDDIMIHCIVYSTI